MKANSILKIAVVATAALAAYAFNGSNANDLKPFYIDEGGVCTDILASCSENSQGTTCMILYYNGPKEILGLDCEVRIKHDNSEYVEWQ